MALPTSLLAEPEPFDDLPPGGQAAPAPRPVPAWAETARRVRPTVLAVERTLPVLPALADLLPDGLRRGSSIGVSGPGSRSLVLALIAEATSSGSWAAVVGDPDLGLVAAAEVGVALERLAVVVAPEPAAWGDVVGALVGALDLVLVSPRHRVRSSDARRLAARARERGSVLIRVGGVTSGVWPDRPDLQLDVAAGVWVGPGAGHGRLRLRRVEVSATGRRTAARGHRATLLLPSPDGRPAPPDGSLPGPVRP